MIRLAFETPIECMTDIQPLADFDWILAHEVLQNKEYAEFYKNSTRMKVLDNSVNELLTPCSFRDIEKSAEIVNPDWIVSPDWLGDGKKTFDYFSEFKTNLGIGFTGGLLPVLQGSTLTECFSYAEKYQKLEVEQLAIPYDITCKRTDSLEKMAISRLSIVTTLLRKKSFKWIHLLGLTSLFELESYSNWPKVSLTLDTGSPIANGLAGRKYGKAELLGKSVPTYEVMEESMKAVGIEMADWSLVFYNIAYLRKLTA